MNEGLDDCGMASASRYSYHGCRCDACRRANREKCARQRAKRPKGLLDAEPVKRRLMRLYDQGYTAREVSRITGVSCSELRNIAKSGKGAKVKRGTKDALCSLRGQRHYKAGSKVDAGWMAEWLEGYRRDGLTLGEIAGALGVSRGTVARIIETKRTTASTLRAFPLKKRKLDEIRRARNEGSAA